MGMRTFLPTSATLAPMYAFDLGRIAYQRAFEIQQQAQAFVLQGGDDILLLLEHPPTVTLGKNSGHENLPPNLAAMWGSAVDVVHSTRGGNIPATFPVSWWPTPSSTSKNVLAACGLTCMMWKKPPYAPCGILA